MDTVLNQRSVRLLALVGAFSALQGCSSAITSARLDNPSDVTNVSGVFYHMPKRAIRVDIAVADPPSSNSASASSSTVSNTFNNSPSSSGGGQDGNSPEGKMSCPATATYCEFTQFKKGDTTTTKINTKEPEDPTTQKKKETTKKIVTVTIANNFNSETRPDLGETFVLQYNKNLFGQNNAAIAVSSFGLLSVTHADTINKTEAIASNIAMDVASASIGAGFLTPPVNNNTAALATYSGANPGSYIAPSSNSATYTLSRDFSDCPNGNYTIAFNPGDNPSDPSTPNSLTICGVKISYKELFPKRLGQAPNDFPNPLSSSTYVARPKRGVIGTINNVFNIITQPNYGRFSSDKGFSPDLYSGLFYRLDLPYEVSVQVSGKTNVSKFLALSPNESATFFAPITETVFASNTSDITLTNGVMSGLKETTDSELYVMSRIPADILGSYTNAVGQAFSALGTATTAQSQYQQSLTISTVSAQVTKCLKAVATFPTAGLTGTALQSAQANINAACVGN